MEGAPMQLAAQQPPKAKMQSEAQSSHKAFRNGKRKQLQHSADIVFTKGAAIKTIASLSKNLSEVTEPVIGLQYIWEYRSPSKSVPPHYQCKLCNVSRLQHDMLAHIKGWKHGFRYIKRVSPAKVTCEEEEAVKDPALRKAIKEVAAEIEKTEGRGQLKVILKEPFDVPAFKGLRTAIPKPVPLAGIGMGPRGPNMGGRFSDPGFPGEYPPHGRNFHDTSMGDLGDMDIGGFSARQDFPGSDMNQRWEGGDGFDLGGVRDGFGIGGLLGDSPGRGFPGDGRGNLMGSSSLADMDRASGRPGLMGAHPEGSNLPATLLSHLDTFRIENEDDAQIVLKVTQKLTDVLMEYRLRSVSGVYFPFQTPEDERAKVGSSLGSSVANLSGGSMGYSSSASRLSNAGDRYSGDFSGPLRFSDGPSRFYN